MESQKPRRSYHSTRRQAQARQTRWQILSAARELFIEKGYNGATIEAIARQAGVAQETVFAAFGNKRNLLSALVDVAVGGDDLPIPWRRQLVNAWPSFFSYLISDYVLLQ